MGTDGFLEEVLQLADLPKPGKDSRGFKTDDFHQEAPHLADTYNHEKDACVLDHFQDSPKNERDPRVFKVIDDSAQEVPQLADSHKSEEHARVLEYFVDS